MSKTLISCSELVRMIVWHLRPVYPSVDELPNLPWYCPGDEPDAESIVQARKDLVSMAQTCSRVSHHALDALWEVLDDVEPLLKVLPFYSRGSYLVRDSGWPAISRSLTNTPSGMVLLSPRNRLGRCAGVLLPR